MGTTSPPHEDWLVAYALGDQLEANALTATFRAERRSDRRKVLVKTVRPGLRKADPALALLARERDVVEAVGHGTLPRLLEVVRDPDRLALVYEDAGGHRLSDVLDRVERLAPWSAMAVGVAIGGTFAALHRAGFVHGRLRAESVELTERGEVILHDPSGVGARGVGGDPDLDAPENMAPEQVLGQAAGPETDVFLLGKLLYQMVTGTLPFQSGAGGITQQIRHGEAPPLSSLAPDAPRELQAIVTRCLKKRGRDRYPDMASLQSEVLRVLRSNTSLAREHLIVDALAKAGLASELPAPRERGVERGATAAPPWLKTAAAWAAAVAGVIVLVIVGWSLVGGDDARSGSEPQGIVKRPAELRVLARPWAEIHIDGELVEITPVARPIEVTPGHHTVQFKHPNSETVVKEIEIISGQTILLDVEMPVVRSPDAGAPDASSPDAGEDASADDSADDPAP
jgi:serine/threonine-protein kinase